MTKDEALAYLRSLADNEVLAEGWPKLVQAINLVVPSYALIQRDMDARAEALMARGQKILAIKLVREITGMGLKEGKDYVEERWEHLCAAYRAGNGW